MVKARSFTEDFTSFSSSKWYRSNATSIQFTSGQLQLTPTTSYDYMDSANHYDLTASYFSIQFVQNCNTGNNNSITTNIRVEVDSTNFFEFEIGGGPSGLVTMRERVAGVDSNTTTTYSSTTFAYLRLREASGTIYWETSTDATTWVVQRSKTSSLNYTSVTLLLMSGHYMAETSPGIAIFDNLNPSTKTETFTDDFTSADTNKWTGYGGGVASVSNGKLVLAAAGDYYPPLESASQYILTGSYAAFQLVQNLPAGNGTYTTLFYANVDASNSVSFTIDGGSGDYVSMTEKVAGVSSSQGMTFNPFRHKWFRIREASGTVYWETSMDGATWVIRRSKTTTLNLNAVTLGFNAGAYGTEPDQATATAIVDNFNLNSGTTIGADLPLPFSLLTDNFDTLDGSKWYSPGNAIIDTGRWKFPVASNAYNYAYTSDKWDLTGTSVCWQLVQNANAGNGTITAQYILQVDTSNWIELRISGGDVATMRIMQRVAGTDTIVTTKTYDKSKNQWFRFRESAGTLYWETSVNGATWSVFYSNTPPVSVASLTFKVIVGSYDIETNPGDVIIDNFNLPNASILSQIGWSVGATMPFGGVESGTVQARNFFQNADWLWNPIPANPVLDPMSSVWSAELETGSHSVAVWDYADTIVLPTEISASTPRYTITFSNYPAWGPDPFAGYTVPIPDGTQVPPGSDGHLCLMDPTTGKVFSLWQAYKSGSSWYASWGGISDLNGDGRDYIGGATAANISRAAGVVLDNEILAGEIPHALFSASGSAGPAFRYPAQKSDGVNMAGVANPVPEGIRIQLNPAIDLSAIAGITPGELAVGRAMQKYGVYILDQGGGGPGFGCQLRYMPGPGLSGNYLETPTVYRSAGFLWDYFDMTHIPFAGNLRVLKNWDGS